MFVKEIDKFKKNVEISIKDFFNCTPDELNDMRVSMFNFYGPDIEKDYKEVKPEYRNEVMKYKTVCYFDNIYKKLIELEEVIHGTVGI